MRFLPFAGINSSFPSVIEYCSIPLYGYINLCTQIPADGHFDSFQFPAITNKAALRFLVFFFNGDTLLLCCAVLCLVMSDFFAAPWTVAHQAPLSMGFPREECYSRLPFPTPGDLFDSGIKCVFLSYPALADGLLLEKCIEIEVWK